MQYTLTLKMRIRLITIHPQPEPEKPQTGDDSNLGFYIGLGSVAVGGLIAFLIIKFKKKDEDDE